MFQLTVLVLAVLTLGTLATRSDRIVGGQTATRGQFPHAASLRANNGSFHFCGATIISNRFVLSAAHCTQGRFSNVREVQVAVGAHTRYDGTLHTVSRIANHPRFTMDRIQNDVSVVQTARTIVFGPTVRAISLPTSNLAPSTQVVVTDWGQHRVSISPLSSIWIKFWIEPILRYFSREIRHLTRYIVLVFCNSKLLKISGSIIAGHFYHPTEEIGFSIALFVFKVGVTEAYASGIPVVVWSTIMLSLVSYLVIFVHVALVGQICTLAFTLSCHSSVQRWALNQHSIEPNANQW